MILGGTALLVCGIDPATERVYPLPIDPVEGLLVNTSGLQEIKWLGGTTVVGCTIDATTGRVYAIPVSSTGIIIGGGAVEVVPNDNFIVLCGTNPVTGKTYALPKGLSGSLVEVTWLGGSFKLACGITANEELLVLPVTSTDWQGTHPISPRFLGDTAVVVVGIDPTTEGQVVMQMDSVTGVIVQVAGPGAGYWPDRYYSRGYYPLGYFN